MTKFNTGFIVDRTTKNHIKLHVAVQRGNEEGPSNTSYITFIVACLFLSAVILYLTFKKIKRTRETQKKFADIKELEQDFDVYVTDDYKEMRAEQEMAIGFVKNNDQF